MGWTEHPAALNGPQYLAGRGSTDPVFRVNADMIRVPTTPRFGQKIPEPMESLVTMAVRI
jgi:hypothetical protein